MRYNSVQENIDATWSRCKPASIGQEDDGYSIEPLQAERYTRTHGKASAVSLENLSFLRNRVRRNKSHGLSIKFRRYCGS